MPPPLNIALFSGGTACRSLNIALCRGKVELTRIVPAWDSGGSSKALREAFDMLPVGDIRQALMTMAHGEGHAGEVVKICNARLSDHLGRQELLAELDFYVDGAHPLLHRMAPDLRNGILDYLRLFRERLTPDFDLRGGSIGNFIMAGAYFANGRDINRAIAVFRALCSIEGNVWPVTTADGIHLSARLANGKSLNRQHLITRLDGNEAAAGIETITLVDEASGPAVVANEAVVTAIERADLIVFGPGSFYTSILPHLLVDDVARTIASNRSAPKVFVGNILQCAETRGKTLGDLVETFVAMAGAKSGGLMRLTHVLGNSDLFPFEKTVGKFPYLNGGSIETICRAHAIRHIAGDFEDAWTRGQHDGEALAAALLQLIRTS